MKSSPRVELSYQAECKGKHVLAEVIVNEQTQRREFVVKRLAAGQPGPNGLPRDRSQGEVTTPLADVPLGSFPVMCACNRTYLLSGSQVLADHQAGIERVFLTPIAS